MRSLFEGAKGTTNYPTSRSGAEPSHAPVKRSIDNSSAQSLSRASLDVPRPQPTWSVIESVTEPDPAPSHKTAQAPPVPGPRRPLSRILPRPSSTILLSAPQSTPHISIESPKSPNKLSELGSLLPSRQIPRIGSEIYDTRHSGHAILDSPTLARHKTTSNVSPSNVHAKKQNVKSEPEHQSFRDSNGDGPITQNSKGLPPAVNRTEKPQVPRKPAFIPVKDALKSPTSAADDGTSPFSTPPSSDENPELSGCEHQGKRERMDKYSETAQPAKSSHSQSASSLSIPDAVPSSRRTLPTKAQNFEPTSTLPIQTQDSLQDRFEARPALPPRKIRDHHSKSRTRDPGEISPHPQVDALPLAVEIQMPAASGGNSQYLPPPKRLPTKNVHDPIRMVGSSQTSGHDQRGDFDASPESHATNIRDVESSGYPSASSDYPDMTNVNRRHPLLKLGVNEIKSHFDTRLIEICGRYVAATGHYTKVWNLLSGDLLLSLNHLEKEARMTSLAFKPAAKASEEGSVLWLGSNSGDIQEIDIAGQNTISNRVGAHERREIIRIHRHQSSMWTLDDGGRMCIWPGNEAGLPDLKCNPKWQRLPKGHVFSIVVHDYLWLATGKDIRVFQPGATEGAPFALFQEPLSQPSTGNVTSGAVIAGQLDRVYFGHTCGRISIYSVTNFTCMGVVCVSGYKISCLTGAGFYLWAGYSSGNIQVYDTRTQPWIVKKDWFAHDGPALGALVDRSSLWKEGVLRVVSLGADNALRFWDGTLADDELGKPSRA